MMASFVDENRQKWGVEPICAQLPIAPASYYRIQTEIQHPEKQSDRRKNDQKIITEIDRVFKDNYCVYGARKIWLELHREGIAIARCTVERLMRHMGIRGVVRGEPKKTTYPDPNNPMPGDLVQREFVVSSPNQLWVADFTYVSTWSGFVYVAFVIDAFANTIVGWKASRRMTADLTLDALEQALWSRPVNANLIHHSDHGSQYLSIRYSDRLKEMKINASTGTVGDAYDNALAETINGLYKTELIRRRNWKGLEDVEYETLKWVHWFNTKRIMSSKGDLPPAEIEKAFYTVKETRFVEPALTQ